MRKIGADDECPAIAGRESFAIFNIDTSFISSKQPKISLIVPSKLKSPTGRGIHVIVSCLFRGISYLVAATKSNTSIPPDASPARYCSF